MFYNTVNWVDSITHRLKLYADVVIQLMAAWYDINHEIRSIKEKAFKYCKVNLFHNLKLGYSLAFKRFRCLYNNRLHDS